MVQKEWPFSSVKVIHDVDIGGALTVSGSTTFNNSITVNSTLDVTGNITAGADVSVSGSVTVSTDLTVSGNASVGGYVTHKTPLVANSASPTLGTGGTLGAAVDLLTPDANHVGVVPVAVYAVVGGTVGTSETITIQINAVFSDGTTASVSKTATATGKVNFGPSDLYSLFKAGVYITKLTVQASSSATSTSATVTAYAAGIQQ